MSVIDVFQKNRRFGRFYLSRQMVEQSPQEVMNLFPQCIVLEVKVGWAFDQMEYLAWSPLFDMVPENSVIPVYDIEVTTKSDVLGNRSFSKAYLVRQGGGAPYTPAEPVAVKKGSNVVWERIDL